ncbi:MAG: ribosome small subunit-dependent GTPase A [Steroidobacteraceae bacterium]
MKHPASASSPGSSACIIAAHGRHFRIRLDDGSLHAARPARRDVQPVCGDRVRCELDQLHGEYRIVAIETRRTRLARTDSRGASELLAANVTLMLTVAAPQPLADFFIIDRYLAGAACAGMRAAVVLNKQDLGISADTLDELAAYRRTGYTVLSCSSRDLASLQPLQDLLRDETAILVGQSGVGKSSLLKALIPGSDAQVGALDRSDEGRHTTVASRLYELAAHAALIDSPGVRDFAPAIADLEPSTLGFIDVAQLAPRCRFPDCRHLAEPDCAVRLAAGSDTLSARRYESYRRMRRLYERLQPPPGGRRR